MRTLAALELRRCIGDAWESLLVSGSSDSELQLRLPRVHGPADSGDNVAPELHVQTVATLAFSPADAIDLLTSLPSAGLTDLRRGASIRYWARVAALVLELLARQRFAPALHHSGADRYRGYWRIVIDDDETSQRLGALIASMPPVCRSASEAGADIQASTTVENFLWTTVDALVRRCLEGDELADAIQDRAGWDASPQMRWLRSLVSVDPQLDGPSHERHLVREAVEEWVAKLEPVDRGRDCRTCFQLHAPEEPIAGQESTSATGWRLTVHVQALGESGWVVDAAQLWDAGADNPKILRRPFADVREQVLRDLQHAARYCEPLGRWPGPPEPMEFSLTLDEAYRFLRDAAPVLKLEGHGIWLPKWWHDDRPRLHLKLEIRPAKTYDAAQTPAFGLDTLVDYDWRVAVGDEDLSEDELRSLAQAQEPLVRLRGRWTEVQPRDIDTALRFVEGQRGGTMTVLEGIRQSYVVDHHDTGLPVSGLRAHGWIRKLLSPSEPGAGVEAVAAPTGFLGELRPYQLQGLAWLWFLTKHGLGGCLADDMGLGKTIQLIALWLYERQDRPSPGPTLLIVPMSLVGNWQREIDRFAPSLKSMVHHGLERLSGQEFIDEVAKHDVVISTYGLAHRDLEHLAAVDWHRIALDEAQNIKNPAAKQSVAIRTLHAVHRLALTGTPVENRLSELWSILEFLNASYLGSAGSFRRRFAVPIERHHDTDRAARLRHLIQ
ncbi:MAG: hypothetical protein IID33_15215, partial [Planctomycetes bacterium]|nr:hypothetical protein [Planctomycetota bacterium]